MMEMHIPQLAFMPAAESTENVFKSNGTINDDAFGQLLGAIEKLSPLHQLKLFSSHPEPVLPIQEKREGAISPFENPSGIIREIMRGNGLNYVLSKTDAEETKAVTNDSLADAVGGEALSGQEEDPHHPDSTVLTGKGTDSAAIQPDSGSNVPLSGGALDLDEANIMLESNSTEIDPEKLLKHLESFSRSNATEKDLEKAIHFLAQYLNPQRRFEDRNSMDQKNSHPDIDRQSLIKAIKRFLKDDAKLERFTDKLSGNEELKQDWEQIYAVFQKISEPSQHIAPGLTPGVKSQVDSGENSGVNAPNIIEGESGADMKPYKGDEVRPMMSKPDQDKNFPEKSKKTDADTDSKPDAGIKNIAAYYEAEKSIPIDTDTDDLNHPSIHNEKKQTPAINKSEVENTMSYTGIPDSGMKSFGNSGNEANSPSLSTYEQKLNDPVKTVQEGAETENDLLQQNGKDGEKTIVPEDALPGDLSEGAQPPTDAFRRDGGHVGDHTIGLNSDRSVGRTPAAEEHKPDFVNPTDAPEDNASVFRKTFTLEDAGSTVQGRIPATEDSMPDQKPDQRENKVAFEKQNSVNHPESSRSSGSGQTGMQKDYNRLADPVEVINSGMDASKKDSGKPDMTGNANESQTGFKTPDFPESSDDTEKIHVRESVRSLEEGSTNKIPSDGNNNPAPHSDTNTGSMESFDRFGQSIRTDHKNSPQPATSPASANTSTADEKSVMDQVINKAILELGNGKSELKIHITPENLGNIKIEVITDHQATHARITAESMEVKEIIERHIDQLKTDLNKNGFEIEGIEVSVEQHAGSDRSGTREGYAKHVRNWEQFSRQANFMNKKDMEGPGTGRRMKETAIDYYA